MDGDTIYISICPFVDVVGVFERRGEDETAMKENGFRLGFI